MLLFYTVFDSIVCILWLVTGFMPSGDQCGNDINECWAPFLVCWWLAIFFDLCRAYAMPWLHSWFPLIQSKADVLPLNTPLMVERYQLFVILSIGEIVTASLASEGYSSSSSSSSHDDDGGHGEDDEHRRGLEANTNTLDEDEESDASAPSYKIVMMIVALALLTKL